MPLIGYSSSEKAQCVLWISQVTDLQQCEESFDKDIANVILPAQPTASGTMNIEPEETVSIGDEKSSSKKRCKEKRS